jgi:HK97 family phage portal protein
MIADLVARTFAGVRNAVLDNPAMSPQDPATWAALTNGPEAEAGVRVTHTTALSVPAVWQAVSLISGHGAVMTLNIQKRMPEDDWTIDHDHVWQYTVSTRWNAETSAFEGWRRLWAHTCLYENGYAYIDPGDPRRGLRPSLYNLLPDRTRAHRDDRGNLLYVTEVDGKLEPVPKERVLHVKGLTLDARGGYDLISAARNSIGLAIAAQGYASRFFSNGAQSGGYLEVPPHWQDKAVKNLEEGFYRKYTGKDNWFKVVILRDGAKFHQSTIDAQKSQLTETREEQAREVARIFNLPPNKLGLEESQSYGSAEQAQLNYLTDCLTPRREAVVAEATIKLFTDEEQLTRSHRFKHDTMKIIELDVRTHNEVLAIQRSNEVINANEWRRDIGLAKRQDPGGEQYFNPNAKPGAPGSEAEAAAPSELLDLPDVRQSDDYSCGAACAMAVGRYFGVGPTTLEEWKAALGTDKAKSTDPMAIVSYLSELGLSVMAAGDMTVDDLKRFWQAGAPVICPIQEYGIPSKQASFKYGHYVVSIGVALGCVFVFDPSIDNALARPGGSQGKKPDPGVDQAAGESLIREDDWLDVWHDQGADGREYVRFGIAVSDGPIVLPAPPPQPTPALPPATNPPKPAEDGDQPPAKKPNKTAAAARGVLRDAADRGVRQVLSRAKAKAKEPKKFLAWIDGNAAEERLLWRKIVTPAAGLAATVLDTERVNLAAELEADFFEVLLGRLKPLVEPPHRESQLLANVTNECATLENAEADRLVAAYFPEGS